MSIDKYEFIYNSSKQSDKKLLAQLQTENIAFKEFDVHIDDQGITPTRLKGIADGLGIKVHELVDPKLAEENGYPEYKDLSEEDLLDIVSHNLELLDTPIAINGQGFIKIAYADSLNKMKKKDGKTAADSEFFQQ